MAKAPADGQRILSRWRSGAILRCRRPSDRGRATEHDKLVGVLHDLALAGQYVPAMFLLKARHGYREGEQVGVNVNIDTGGVLVVPNKLTMEDFLEAQRQAGLYDSPVRPDAVERIPGQRAIEAVLDPETRRATDARGSRDRLCEAAGLLVRLGFTLPALILRG